MNFFDSSSAAARYAKARPYYHPVVVQHIKDFLSLSQPLDRTLDVGCGTGLSSIALTDIARQVLAIDPSSNMIALAARNLSVNYVIAAGEALPFLEREFDLVTVSQVFHWLDENRFLTEARRVLRDGSWLIAYDSYFGGKMVEETGFSEWFHDNYPRRFPAPTRGAMSFDEKELGTSGFALAGQERFPGRFTFSLSAIVEYLLSQSNVIAAVEFGSEKIEEVRSWLTEKIAPFFGDREDASFEFNNVIWYLKRQEQAQEQQQGQEQGNRARDSGRERRA